MKLKPTVAAVIQVAGKLNRNQNASVRWGTGSHKSIKDYTRKPKHKKTNEWGY